MRDKYGNPKEFTMNAPDEENANHGVTLTPLEEFEREHSFDIETYYRLRRADEWNTVITLLLMFWVIGTSTWSLIWVLTDPIGTETGAVLLLNLLSGILFHRHVNRRPV